MPPLISPRTSKFIYRALHLTLILYCTLLPNLWTCHSCHTPILLVPPTPDFGSTTLLLLLAAATSSGCCSVNLAKFFSACPQRIGDPFPPACTGYSQGTAPNPLGGWWYCSRQKYRVFSPTTLNMTGQSSVSQPLPILQPTTPHALPLARTSSGKISAGYSHGTVNQVAPKTEVKMYTNAAAAAPYAAAVESAPVALALRPLRAMPPARNMAMLWPTAP